eukprot:gnl/TRDRNA2_/TRDRNA2_165652_c0_seq1.p1 gnl/TRDRNA2_/TRDRNA2_165652_c0~~gnl/TRDRNA2_/TRDRNA2_165652_c0_seq1.p1  ORF type:complete len:477 (-),score=79.28 gnl/TRDRNA2_/TRDRNA2_165652_c0_seq1:56-1486(-)
MQGVDKRGSRTAPAAPLSLAANSTVSGVMTTGGNMNQQFDMTKMQHIDAGEIDCAPVPEQEIQAFCLQHGLDLTCMEALASHHPMVIREATSSFKPKQGTKDMSGLFKGFLKSVANNLAHGVKPIYKKYDDKGKGKGKRKGPDGQPLDAFQQIPKEKFNPLEWPETLPPGMENACLDPVPEIELEAFCVQHGLDASCLNDLKISHPLVQREAVETFNPKTHTKDMVALFKGFIKSIATNIRKGIRPGKGKGKGEEEDENWDRGIAIQEFAARWSLNEDCIAFLWGQPEEVQDEVLMGWDPKPYKKEPTGMFMNFVKSIAQNIAQGKGKKGKAKGKGKGLGMKASIFARVGMTMGPDDEWQAPDTSASSGQEIQPWSGESRWDSNQSPESMFMDVQTTFYSTAGWVHQWGLDAECGCLLFSQEPHIQQQVMKGFNPPPGTKDIKPLFMLFVKSVLESSPEAPLAKKRRVTKWDEGGY